MLQAILVSIVAFLAAIDEYTFGASMMGRPLFTVRGRWKTGRAYKK